MLRWYPRPLILRLNSSRILAVATSCKALALSAKTICDGIDPSNPIDTFKLFRDKTLIIADAVWSKFSGGLFKVETICVAVQIVSNRWYISRYVWIAVFIKNVYGSFDHLFFSDLPAIDITLGEVSIEPYFDHAFFVDANMLLLDFEIAVLACDDLEAEKCLKVEMEAIWEGNMLYICQSDRYFFDKEGTLMVGGAELLLLLFLEEDPWDELRVLRPELEGFLLMLILFAVFWVYIVLLDVKSGVLSTSPEAVGVGSFHQIPLFLAEWVYLTMIAAHDLFLQSLYYIFKLRFIPSLRLHYQNQLILSSRCKKTYSDSIESNYYFNINHEGLRICGYNWYSYSIYKDQLLNAANKLPMIFC